MTDFYLITGFLGAGKTTFLKKFIRLFAGKTMRLIINEFGNEGVDGKLLSELGATLNEISGGSIFCSCRLDKFEEALEDGLAQGPELLIVEASGLSDPTNIRKILEENEKQGRLKYKGCICLVDSVRFPKVFNTARVVKKQLAVGDVFLLNKTDIATDEQIQNVTSLITDVYPDVIMHKTEHGFFDEAWLSELNPYRRIEDIEHSRPDITLQKMMVSVSHELTRYELERFISMFAEETARIKGFVRLLDSGWLLLDCVGPMVRVESWTGSTDDITEGINILATPGQQTRAALKKAISWYEDKITLA